MRNCSKEIETVKEELNGSLITVNYAIFLKGFPGGSDGKEPACNMRPQFDRWVRKIPWRKEWPPIPVFLPGESHRQRSLAGYSRWDHKELDVTEQLSHTHTFFFNSQMGLKVYWRLKES